MLIPPTNIVKELDHKFLLIGKSRFHILAMTIKRSPAKNNIKDFLDPLSILFFK
jgi:hypothetical protein